MRAFSILHGKSHGRAPPAGDRSLARFVSTRLHAALQQQAADAHEAEVARLIADGGSSEEVARLERRFAATTQHLAASAEAAAEAVALSLEKCALALEYESTLAQMRAGGASDFMIEQFQRDHAVAVARVDAKIQPANVLQSINTHWSCSSSDQISAPL